MKIRDISTEVVIIMRILIISNADFNLVLGSAATLAIKGHDVFHVICSEDLFQSFTKRIQVEVHEGLPVPITQITIPVIRQETVGGRKIRPLRVSASVLALLKDTSPEVIVTHPECWMLARSISNKLHVPLVFYSMNIRALGLFSWLLLYHKYSELLSAPFSCIYNIVLAHRSDFTLASGKRIEKFLRFFGVRKIATLRPPFARFQFLSKKTDIELPESYVLTITTLTRVRNVKVDLEILQTVINIARRLPDVTFVVVGTSINDLKPLGKTSMVPENVRLVGKIFDDNLLGRIYKKASCVLCPIRYPTISNRVHEALFYERPIIMTKTIADFYGGFVDGTHCIIEEDFGKWPAKIRRLISDDNIKEKLERGAKSYYTKAFSPEQHALILEQTLNSVVKRARLFRNHH